LRAIQIALGTNLMLQRVDLPLVREDLESPAFSKSAWAAKKVAAEMRSSPVAAMWASAADSRVPPMQ